MSASALHPPAATELAGLPIASLTAEEVVTRVFGSLAAGQGGWLVTANVDFLLRAARDPATLDLYRRADLILADGQPLLWAARLQGTPLPERVTGSDLVWMLARRAAREGRRLYLLGGEGDAAAGAAERLRSAIPGLLLAGWSSPRVSLPASQEEIAEIRSALAAARPDLVYVALGSPKQEQVIAAVRSHLPATWMMGCGVSLSFVAGTIPRAPRWLQRLGLEWLHRLAQEPGRLARRYLWDDLPFALALLLHSARKGRGWADRSRDADQEEGT